MAIVIAVAWYAISAIGGMHPMLVKLAAMRAACRSERQRCDILLPGFFAAADLPGNLGAPDHHVRGEPRTAVVGFLVSGRGTWRGRLHCATHFQRAR